jgi:hypothetical protein
LLLQKEKAKKRASAGGSVAGGDAAASSLLFELADLLFRAFREQWNCFKENRQEVLLSIESRNSADAGAEPEKEKSDAAKRKNKSGPKREVKKYYAVAVGRKTGVFTTWDEADRSVNKYSGSIFKGFKHKAEAKAWLWEKRRQQPRSRRRAHSSSDDSSGGDDGRRGRGRRGNRDRM